MNVLITGIRGSAAKFLSDFLIDNGVTVYGLCRSEQYITSNSKVRVHTCDLNDPYSTLNTLEKLQGIDCIIHLASNADVKASWDQPSVTLNNNINSTLNLFESIRKLKIFPTVLMISTSEVYGIVKKEYTPIKETCPLNPANPYAISKLAQDMLAKVYYEAYDIPIIRLRSFGYINPYRTNLFATSFARQIALIENNKQEFLFHGNLDSIRTLLDCSDLCEAYWRALFNCTPGEVYNVGSELPVSVKKVLDILISYSSCEIKTRENSKLLRQVDITLQIPDCRKFRETTNWAPKIPLETSLKNLLSIWRENEKT